VINRFGKPSASWFKAKKWFFDQDRELLAECHRIATLYRKQPARVECKNCAAPLGEAEFQKHGIGYALCARCGHLNGLHQDTEAFCEGIYTESESDLYSRAYASDSRASYEERCDTIYRPKADFLLDALVEQGEKPSQMTFADVGAGSGYFVSALKDAGVKSVRGYDVSETQVKLANYMLGDHIVEQQGLVELLGTVENADVDVLTLVFALEHVQDPRGLLSAACQNRRARYAFVAIPLFGPCVFFEMAFPEFAHRHLTCGHTHLYTRQSVDWMCAEFGLERLAEWWFGADVVDLYRMIWMTMSRNPELAGMVGKWEEMMLPVVDEMQLAVDKKKLSSEVHFLVRLPAGSP